MIIKMNRDVKWEENEGRWIGWKSWTNWMNEFFYVDIKECILSDGHGVIGTKMLGI